MKVTLHGTRGSVGRAGPETMGFGGDTSCVEVTGDDGSLLVLDAGSGLARLNTTLPPGIARIDLLLTHLHMDHLQGLGFFRPLWSETTEVHLWGPVSSTMSLSDRLSRYLSPPLFPVRIRDLPALRVHNVRPGTFPVGTFTVSADLVCHPGNTLGYRVSQGNGNVAYLPDHEPALGCKRFPKAPEWTSGHDISAGADLLLHDFQYTAEEYPRRVGWGHSAMWHTLAFAEQAQAGRLVTFHHDPEHDDATLERLHEEAAAQDLSFELIPGKAGLTIEL
ncbi:MAG: MBL fold metallo-hydrolase [Actinomycetota bacterium]